MKIFLHNQFLPSVKKPRATNVVLNFSILPFVECFVLKIHFEETIDLSFGLGTTSHTSFFIIDWYYLIMAYIHSFFLEASLKTCGFFINKISHYCHIIWMGSLCWCTCNFTIQFDGYYHCMLLYPHWGCVLPLYGMSKLCLDLDVQPQL